MTEPAPRLLLVDHLYPPHYKSPTALLLYLLHHLTCGISSLLRPVNLILFTVLLVHLILRASPLHSPRLRSHHPPFLVFSVFFSRLKLISFTHHWPGQNWALAFVCLLHIFLFFVWFAWLSWVATVSFSVHVQLSYRVVSYRIVLHGGRLDDNWYTCHWWVACTYRPVLTTSTSSSPPHTAQSSSVHFTYSTA